MQKNLLKIYDTVSLRPLQVAEGNSQLLQVKDAEGRGRSLLTRIAATHAGRLTRNHGFYPPHHMRNGVGSFLEPFPKPILVNHDEEAIPLGRVKSARYIDTSPALLDKFRNLADCLRNDADQDSIFKMIDTLGAELFNPAFPGLGYIELVADITDPEAIQRILDKRYLTVSTGMVTDAAICSICKTNWVEDGKCDHSPGSIVDDKPCFLICGNMRYIETSFVNRPADDIAMAMDFVLTEVQDRVQVEPRPFYEVVFDAFVAGPDTLINVADPHHVNLYGVHDKLQEVLHLMKANQSEPQPDAQIKPVIDKLLQDASLEISSFADQEIVIKIHNHFHDAYDWQVKGSEVPGMAPDRLQLHAKLHTTAIAGGFLDSFVRGDLDKTLEDQGVAMPLEAEGKDKQDASEQTVTNQETSDQEITLLDLEEYLSLDEEAKYALIAQELDALTAETGDASFTDAKLSTEARQKLKKSTFCGPNKSFPVPDRFHVTANQRLISRYQGPGKKEAIEDSIQRKAKALGCGAVKEKADGDAKEGQELLTQDQLREQRQQLLDQVKDLEQQLTDRFQEVFTCDACQEKEARITALTAASEVNLPQLEALEQDYHALEDENLMLRDQLANHLTDTIIDHRQLQAGQALDEAARGQMCTELQDRCLESLQDTVKDLRSRTDWHKALKLDGLANEPESGRVPDPTLGDSEVAETESPEIRLRTVLMKTYQDFTRVYGQRTAQIYLDQMKKAHPGLFQA
jgi:hypothetical protein